MDGAGALPAVYAEYWPILIASVGAFAFATLIVVLPALFKARRPNPVKQTPFECGIPILGPARIQVAVRFYLFALLFLLFDMETMFIFVWAAIFRDSLLGKVFLLVEMGVFIFILLVGYVYAWRKGAFQWT